LETKKGELFKEKKRSKKGTDTKSIFLNENMEEGYAVIPTDCEIYCPVERE